MDYTVHARLKVENLTGVLTNISFRFHVGMNEVKSNFNLILR